VERKIFLVVSQVSIVFNKNKVFFSLDIDAGSMVKEAARTRFTSFCFTFLNN
jgi:hypothetical protein